MQAHQAGLRQDQQRRLGRLVQVVQILEWEARLGCFTHGRRGFQRQRPGAPLRYIERYDADRIDMIAAIAGNPFTRAECGRDEPDAAIQIDGAVHIQAADFHPGWDSGEWESKTVMGI